ncbi:MATE family efflux transporter [methane-oxidizing endosymbiont of Gigantopelta aegis]|uniref:MATE family efflux transporter n=1 Tax=methane-oxidizing endosymbiont of Gigantopelta aegis TaxID=2794938 RepID=UPI0018DC9C25|nr:MATE family efflux transporter [methane-oxidizing endosymbiont of Gigantopelta aegis]
MQHRSILRLAAPIILANISTPLLGLVDTAVLGHLDSARFLAAVALAGVIFNFIYWGFGFLRMGTTGIVAQAAGLEQTSEVKACLLRALMTALMLAGIILWFRHDLARWGFYLLHGPVEVEALAGQYYQIRIWSAPATLSLYVLTGWFLGLQNMRAPLLIVLVTNGINIMLDFMLVYHWQLGVKGVALASVIAEFCGLLTALAILLSYRHYLAIRLSREILFNTQKLKQLLRINSDLFIRTLCLIFAFAFFIAQSTRLGEIVLAANTVLMNFQTFMAYALDGFAHAAEALVGRAIGQRNRAAFRAAVNSAALWSCAVALGFCFVYAIFGDSIIQLLTSLSPVQHAAMAFLPWVVLMPLLAFLSYLFDGVFVGATWSRAMRNIMLFSVFIVFLPAWYFSWDYGNQGLWGAMSVFMLSRSLLMAFVYKRFGLKTIH